eukprot:TRINITY_DN19946_c0_g1_i1.p1 TRINITY_DN19946_c0_g1~~TRINITY_DN19946_c0_g1_i1.p1  ORF type:complete len:119 (-),score=27.64 TRINITY_DN19946_c0_g1_i1:2-358(-)
MGSLTIKSETLNLLRTNGAQWLKFDNNMPGEVLISGNFSAVKLIASTQSTKTQEKSDVSLLHVDESDENQSKTKSTGGATKVKHLLEKDKTPESLSTKSSESISHQTKDSRGRQGTQG